LLMIVRHEGERLYKPEAVLNQR